MKKLLLASTLLVLSSPAWALEVTHPFYTSIVGYVGLTIIYWLFERRRKNKEIYDYNGRLKNGYDNYVSWWTENQAQIPALEQEVNKLNNRYRQTQNRLNKYAVSIGLHEKYQDRSTVEAFLSYVEEGRCDTLKECINLKEQEWQEFLRYQEEYRHRRTVEKAAAQQQEQLEQIREETSRAADESKRAADLAAAEAIFEAVKYYESRKK